MKNHYRITLDRFKGESLLCMKNELTQLLQLIMISQVTLDWYTNQVKKWVVLKTVLQI
jgi:hypothetical protein